MTMSMEAEAITSRIGRLLLLLSVSCGLGSCMNAPETSIDQTALPARLSEEDALKAVLSRYPELVAFRANPGLPPRTILSGKDSDGDWAFAFASLGSGVAGIRSADCYRVSPSGEVVSVGRFTGNRTHPVDHVNPATCRP